MNVQTLEGVVFWCVWFTVLGFLQLLAMLSRDRFEYLSQLSSPTPHVPLLVVLLVILGTVTACLVLSLGIGFALGMLQQMFFMAAECLLQLISILFVLTRYSIYVYDRRLSTRSQKLIHSDVGSKQSGDSRRSSSSSSSSSSSPSSSNGVGWEHRFIAHYYSEFVYESLSLSIDFAHHVHMIFWSRVFISMANLVILLQLRYFYYEFAKRCARHLSYVRLRRLLNSFPLVSLRKGADGYKARELPVCVICWEAMVRARQLPCGHTYHDGCLHLWLEQDATCPACRAPMAPAGALASAQQRSSPPAPAFSFADLAVDTDTPSSNSDAESDARDSVALDEFGDFGAAAASEFATPDASSESRASSAAFHTPDLTCGSAPDSVLQHNDSSTTFAAVAQCSSAASIEANGECEQMCASVRRECSGAGRGRAAPDVGPRRGGVDEEDEEEEECEQEVLRPHLLFPTHPMQLTLDCGALASAPPFFRFAHPLRSASHLATTSCQSNSGPLRSAEPQQSADSYSHSSSSRGIAIAGARDAIASADDPLAGAHRPAPNASCTYHRTRSLSLHISLSSGSQSLNLRLPTLIQSSPSIFHSSDN